MTVFRSSLFLTFILSQVQALIAPAGKPVQLQVDIKSVFPTHCATVNINASGFAIFTQECTTNPGSRSWIVDKGQASAAHGRGAAGHIRVWTDYCMDVKGGVNANGTPVQMWKCSTGNKNQLWEYNSDNSIRWSGTDKCLDAKGGQSGGETLLQIWTCSTGNKNQIWTAHEVAPGPVAPAGKETQFMINSAPFSANRNEGPCMSVVDEGNGAPVVINDCQGPAPKGRTWVVDKGSSATGVGASGQIKFFNGTYCLDVKGGQDADGTALQLWRCTAGNKNQLWHVDGDLTIRWANHNKCVDLYKGLQTYPNKIQIWTCNAKNLHQQWVPSEVNPVQDD